jgi:hypothetical protein
VAAGLSLPDRAAALRAAVSVDAETGRLAEARARVEELRALTAPVGGVVHVKALLAAATVCTRQADYAAAQQALEPALRELDSRTDLMLWLELRLAAAALYLEVTPRKTKQVHAALDEVGTLLDLVGTEVHRQQMLALRAHLALQEGRNADARALSESIDEEALGLPFRDRIRFRALRSKLLILEGKFDEGTRGLQQLAEEAQAAQNAELAAEIWRDLAETLANAYGGRGRGRAADGRAASRRGGS